jgi:hypothetical protein
MMQAVAIALACFGGVTLLLALSRWLARRRWASLGHLVLAGVLLYAAAQLVPLARDLASYGSLRLNQPVAQAYSERTGSRTWRLTLTRLPSGRMQVFEVAGEEWRIDAQAIRWTGRATVLGLPSKLRLERLDTRFVRAGEPAAPAPASYPLAAATAEGPWPRARLGIDWREHATAETLEGDWRPLGQGARWEVWYDGKGLRTRPANEAAAKLPPTG